MAGYHLSIPNLSLLHHRLIDDEGFKVKPYRCSANRLTIGVGHNLEAEGLCREAILAQLEFDIAKARKNARDVCQGFFDDLSGPRQDVLTCMAFQLGRDGLAGFAKMLQAIEAKRYATAADQMMRSRWAKQTFARAKRLATMMETGDYEQSFKEGRE